MFAFLSRIIGKPWSEIDASAPPDKMVQVAPARVQGIRESLLKHMETGHAHANDSPQIVLLHNGRRIDVHTAMRLYCGPSASVPQTTLALAYSVPSEAHRASASQTAPALACRETLEARLRSVPQADTATRAQSRHVHSSATQPTIHTAQAQLEELTLLSTILQLQTACSQMAAGSDSKSTSRGTRPANTLGSQQTSRLRSALIQHGLPG